MPIAATAADSIRLTVVSVEVLHLAAVGTLPGVRIEAIAGANGPGLGRIEAVGPGSLLAWQAPGGSRGEPVDCAVAGLYVLEDADRDKWIRVEAYPDYMGTVAAAAVYIRDVHDNDIGQDAVTAAEAAAGDVLSWTVSVDNVSGRGISDLRAWIAATVAGYEISDDGAAWVSPTTEAAGLVLDDLAAGASDTLHIRRTITAGAPAEADVLALLHLAFNGL